MKKYREFLLEVRNNPPLAKEGGGKERETNESPETEWFEVFLKKGGF